MKPKICFISTVSVTLRTFVEPQARILLKQGWEVHWASARLSPEHSLPEGIVHHELPISRHPSVMESIHVLAELVRLLKREGFLIVQYSSPIASLYGSIAAVLTRTPVRIYAQWGIRYVGFSGSKRTFFKFLERCTCHFSTSIQPDSFGNLAFSVNEGLYKETKAEVVGHGSACGVDLERYRLDLKAGYRAQVRDQYNIEADDFVYGFVGSVRTDKGINELVRAFCSLEAKDTKLILVGDREYEKDLLPDVRKLITSDPRILMTGPVSGVERFLSAFDCLVFPSYREGFGMVVIEAAAMGVPAIVTNIPGPSEAVDNTRTGTVVELHDVGGLKQAMRFYLDSPEKARSQGLEARLRVERLYDRRKLMTAYVENKRQLVEARSQ